MLSELPLVKSSIKYTAGNPSNFGFCCSDAFISQVSAIYITIHPSEKTYLVPVITDNPQAKGAPDIAPMTQPISKVKESDKKVRPVNKWTEKILRRLHYRFPNFAPLQNKEDRQYVHERDLTKNIESRVPPEEELRQRALWGIEIFGPAEIDALYSALKRLAWDEDHFRNPTSGPLKWISEQRMYGSGGSLNLGRIQRRGQGNFISLGREGPIPDAIDYINGYVHQISPSITALIFCFVIKDSQAVGYETALATDQATKYEANWRRGGYSGLGVEHLKMRAVEAERARSRKIVIDWFEEHLPGFFSRAEDGNRLPTAELITSLHEPLLPTTLDGKRKEPAWVNYLKSYRFRTTWTLKDFEGLSLAWDEAEDGNRFHTLINLRTALLNDKHLEHISGGDKHSYVTFVSEHVEGVLLHNAVSFALREVIRTLRLTRDNLTTESNSHREVLLALKHIKKFFDQSIGLPTMTSELVTKSETDHFYRWDCGEFLSEPWQAGEPPIKIAETLRANTHYLASRAMAQEKETRGHLEQICTILSTQQSVRTQKRMEIVTYVATIVAVASLFVALMSVDRFATAINLQVERVFGISAK